MLLTLCLHNFAGVAKSCKALRLIQKHLKLLQMFQVLRNLQNVAGVSVLLKCCKCCSLLKKWFKCCKDFQRQNVANAVELFECCREVKKRSKCSRFPKGALVRRADRDNLQSFMPLSFAVAVLSCNCGWAFAQHKLGS